jgi:hypothetical protein
MADGRFGTAINCMDGRVQDPVAHFLKERYQLDYIDTITEPGPDKLLAEGPGIAVNAIRGRVRISVEKHGSNVIAIAGHHDCAGNPVDRDTHIEQINRAVNVIRSWSITATILGLWVNENWEVEVVS